MKTFFIIIVECFPFLLLGQNVILEGQVFDYTSGNLIKDAYLEIFKETKKLHTVKTDNSGKFKIALETSTYKVLISKENYTSIEYEISLTENKNLTPIFLEDKTVDLDEVVIEARKKNISIDNNGVKLIIDESPFFEGVNVPEAINIMPGVTVSSDNSISVLGKERILILINGRETNLNISDLPAKNVEKIEIDSTPSAKYDARYDVVMNVTLKKWLSQGFSGGVNSTLTINKRVSHNYNTYLNYNKNKFNVSSYFAIDKNETKISDEGYQVLNNVRQENNSENDAKRLSKYAYINFNYDINQTDQAGIELDYLNADSNSDNNGNILFNNNLNSMIIDSSFVSNSKGNWEGKNYSIGGFYTKKKDSYTIDATIKYFKNENDNNSNFVYNRSDIIDPNPFNQITTTNSNSSTFISTLDHKKNLKKQNVIEIGVRYTNFYGNFNLNIDVNNSPLSNTQFEFNENIYAYYTNWEKSFEKVSLQVGARVEYFDRKVLTYNTNKFNSDNLDLFPSFSIDYTPSQKNYYKLSYSKKISRPSFNQITPFEYFTSYNTKFEGNPSLKNEISHNIEFLYYLKQKYNFSFYLNYNKDLIEQTGVIDNDFVTVNIPVNYDYYTFGLQTGFTQKINSWLTSVQKFSIERVTSDGVLLNNNFNTKSWEAHLYFAEIINLKKKGSFIIVGNYFTPQYYDIYKVKEGFKLDVKYSLKLFNNKLTASVTARDLLNTYFNEVSSSYINQSSFIDKDINNRDLVFSLSYVFDKGRKRDIKTGTDIKEEKNRLNNN